MEIQVYQVTKQEDGSYAASLKLIEGDKILKKKTVVASTKEEFKNKIRTFKVAMENQALEHQTLMDIVQTAIDEVMAE